MAYSDVESFRWGPFAITILEAAYEATLWEAFRSAGIGGLNLVLLTLLGGGAFRNDAEWTFDAMRHGLAKVAEYDLDVRIVSRGPPSRELQQFQADFPLA